MRINQSIVIFLWLMEELKNHGRSRNKVKPKDVPNIKSHIICHYESRSN